MIQAQAAGVDVPVGESRLLAPAAGVRLQDLRADRKDALPAQRQQRRQRARIERHVVVEKVGAARGARRPSPRSIAPAKPSGASLCSHSTSGKSRASASYVRTGRAVGNDDDLPGLANLAQRCLRAHASASRSMSGASRSGMTTADARRPRAGPRRPTRAHERRARGGDWSTTAKTARGEAAAASSCPTRSELTRSAGRCRHHASVSREGAANASAWSANIVAHTLACAGAALLANATPLPGRIWREGLAQAVRGRRGRAAVAADARPANTRRAASAPSRRCGQGRCSDARHSDSGRCASWLAWASSMSNCADDRRQRVVESRDAAACRAPLRTRTAADASRDAARARDVRQRRRERALRGPLQRSRESATRGGAEDAGGGFGEERAAPRRPTVGNRTARVRSERRPRTARRSRRGGRARGTCRRRPPDRAPASRRAPPRPSRASTIARSKQNNAWLRQSPEVPSK